MNSSPKGERALPISLVSHCSRGQRHTSFPWVPSGHFCALAPLNSLPTASPCVSVLSGEGGGCQGWGEGAARGGERELLGGGFAPLPHPQPWAAALHQGLILPRGASSSSAFQIPWDLVKKQILFS